MFQVKTKIKNKDEFVSLVKELKGQGKKLVQCDGVFDLVHPGHIHYFAQAKSLGDILYVVVVSDAFVQKGKGRPFFDQDIRALWVAGIGSVDFVVINDGYGPYNIIEAVQPDLLVKGISYQKKATDGFLKDKALVESYGGKVFFSDELDIHSTNIFEKIAKSFKQ
ncbi:MAG: adenylyltransferase/cytidyltransferase family protein [bacterium]|nr:adenylyltransferase/cytidyltransferase family protein [bacterium]